MAVNITSAYPGEFLDKLLTKATIGNELVQKNLIHVEPNVLKTLYIGKLVVGKLLQQHKPMPTADDAKGDFNYTENSLTPDKFMAYTRYLPSTFENLWRKYQPNGPFAMETWNQAAQTEFLEVFSNEISEELGYFMINGIKGTDDDHLFNGIATRILGSKDVLVAGVGETTYAKKFKAMLKRLPKALRTKTNLKFICSIEDADNYDEELKTNVYKNADMTIKQALAYNGIPVVGLAQWPAGLIVLTPADATYDSNLWGAIAWNQDEVYIKTGLVQEDGDMWFLKQAMRCDTNLAHDEYVVICDEREADNSYVKALTSSSDVQTISTVGALLGSKVSYKNTGSGAITVAGVSIAKGATADWYFDGTAWAQKA